MVRDAETSGIGVEKTMKNEDKKERNIQSGNPNSDDAVLYVLGQLSESEEKRFEESLQRTNLPEYEETLETLSALADEIAAKMPAPRRGLKDKVMKAAIQSSEEHAAGGRADLEKFVIRSNEGKWQETGFPGVKLKMLHQVPQSTRSTVLVRIAAGARYPEHRHVGYEECLVVEGDLHINGISLVAGDFILTEDEIEHHDTYSDQGCVLLLSTQLEDEVLEH